MLLPNKMPGSRVVSDGSINLILTLPYFTASEISYNPLLDIVYYLVSHHLRTFVEVFL